MTETTIKTRGELDHLEAANITQGFVWLKRKKNPEILTDSFAEYRKYKRHVLIII